MTTVIHPPPLPFTPEELAEANGRWGCNCGPAALAAFLGMPLEEVRPHLGYFEVKRHMNTSDMIAAFLRIAGKKPIIMGDPCINNPGIAKIQWEGPWTGPGGNTRWAAKFTHWIATRPTKPRGYVWAYDVNNPAWEPLGAWMAGTAERIMEEIPRCSGTFRFATFLTLG